MNPASPSTDIHVVTNDGEQCFMWKGKQLTYIAKDRQELPSVLASRFGQLANKLDLSYNTLTSYRNINLFTNLNELILDNNLLEDDQLNFKQNLRLKTLSLNKNRLCDLSKLISKIKVSFPNLDYLSLIGNPLCPSPVSSSLSSSIHTNIKRRHQNFRINTFGVSVSDNNAHHLNADANPSNGFGQEDSMDFAYQSYRVSAFLVVSSDGQSKLLSKSLSGAANKSCDGPILDTCVTTLMVFGRRGVYLPQNYDEMVPHCQEEFDAEDCIKNYARRCLAPFERQVARMLILGAGQVLRKRCSQEGTREYLSHYKCIKKSIPILHDAMDQLVYTLMSISEEKNVDIKIPTSCCSFARFQDYANKIVKFECSSFDKKAEEYIGTKMIKGYVSDVLDLSCQGYESSGEKCAKIKLPDGGYDWKNNTLIRIKDAKLPLNKPNSVVWPFLDIFTNL